MRFEKFSGILVMSIIKEPEGHEKGGVGIQIHRLSFLNSATVSTFRPGLDNKALASRRNSAAVLFGRRPALVTTRSGLPRDVTVSD